MCHLLVRVPQYKSLSCFPHRTELGYLSSCLETFIAVCLVEIYVSADAVRRNPATCREKDADIVQTMKDSLRFAKDRESGTQQRAAKARTQLARVVRDLYMFYIMFLQFENLACVYDELLSFRNFNLETSMLMSWRLSDNIQLQK